MCLVSRWSRGGGHGAGSARVARRGRGRGGARRPGRPRRPGRARLARAHAPRARRPRLLSHRRLEALRPQAATPETNVLSHLAGPGKRELIKRTYATTSLIRARIAHLGWFRLFPPEVCEDASSLRGM